MNTTILCAQDDRRLFRIYEQALRGEGYRVAAAHDGEEAIARIEEAPPDVVLLDVMLSKRDGFEVLEATRASTEAADNVPVILLCGGSVPPQYLERARALGAATILSQPVPLDQLLEQVRSVTRGATKTASPPAKKARKQLHSKTGSFEGSLDGLDFAFLLHRVHGLHASGVLSLANGKKKKAIEFCDGYPVAVRSNLMSECLGNMLKRSGRLTEEAYRESIECMKQQGGMHGEILVAMDLLNEEEVSAALAAQAEEKLFEIFTWRTGVYQFHAQRRLRRGNSLALEGSPGNIILRGAREHLPLERVDRFIERNAQRVLAPAESPFYKLQNVDLGPEGERLLAEANEHRSLGQYRAADEWTRRTLYALIAAELVVQETGAAPHPDKVASAPPRPATPAPPLDDAQMRKELTRMAQAMRNQNHYEVLGIATTASEDDIREAYEQRLAEVHPDRFATASGAVRQMAEEIYRTVSSAHEVLSDPEARASYGSELGRDARESKAREREKQNLTAEAAFQRGESLLRRRNYESALISLGKAIELNSRDGEYHAHYGWCLHLCHPDDSLMLREAIEHVRRGAKLARDREKPYLFLGRLYKTAGKTDAAEKMFTRAVQIRADCTEAIRELRILNMRREKEKGILGRLLRR